VGASRTISWGGTGRVDLFLSVDGGSSWQLYESSLTGGSHRLVVPHTPGRFAAVKIERAVPRSVSKTPGFFSIETSIELLAFRAALPPEGGGALLSWSTEPGPADLAGYRLERSDAATPWRTIVPLTRETSHTDPEGGAGARYRLFAVNGLGEELLLGEAAPVPPRPLAAWPLPYRGGGLNVSFAIYGRLGAPLGEADVALYDVAGRRVRTLASGTFPSGQQLVTWDGANERGARVPAGIYFLRSRTAGETFHLKLAVLP
jgi:hypothetical protein